MQDLSQQEDLLWLNHNVLLSLVDNFHDQRQNYWFGSNRDNVALFEKHSALRSMVDTSTKLSLWAMYKETTKIAFVPSHQVGTFMHRLNAVKLDLLVAVHMTCGLPA